MLALMLEALTSRGVDGTNHLRVCESRGVDGTNHCARLEVQFLHAILVKGYLLQLALRVCERPSVESATC